MADPESKVITSEKDEADPPEATEPLPDPNSPLSFWEMRQHVGERALMEDAPALMDDVAGGTEEERVDEADNLRFVGHPEAEGPDHLGIPDQLL